MSSFVQDLSSTQELSNCLQEIVVHIHLPYLAAFSQDAPGTCPCGSPVLQHHAIDVFALMGADLDLQKTVSAWLDPVFVSMKVTSTSYWQAGGRKSACLANQGENRPYSYRLMS